MPSSFRAIIMSSPPKAAKFKAVRYLCLSLTRTYTRTSHLDPGYVETHSYLIWLGRSRERCILIVRKRARRAKKKETATMALPIIGRLNDSSMKNRLFFPLLCVAEYSGTACKNPRKQLL